MGSAASAGDAACWHADSAIVESPRGTYILVALAEDPAGGEWMTRIARTVHDAIQPQQVARRP